MNLFFNAIIEGFGRAVGRHIYRYARESLGLGRSSSSSDLVEEPRGLDDDDGDHDDGDGDGDGDDGDAS